ncbi:MAG: thioredoxin domain-containing protein, partial [Solirubrobacteraceae bacterium]
MRAPVETIEAPPFLPQLRWVNVKRLRMEELRGRPVLIEFWDLCRPNSMRTLPYIRAWQERYGGPPPAPPRRAATEGAENGGAHPAQELPEPPRLQVVGIHSPGFEPSRERNAVLAAVERLRIEYPVMIDSHLEMWREYENLGWPARYLFGPDGMLVDYHYGEGAYEETELAIQRLLALDAPPEPLPPMRPEDAPGAVLARQSEDREGAYEGPYEAGGVWAVLD